MDSRYKHLGSEERGVILAEHRRGSSLREIGLVLGRAPSTIGRELARGGSGEAGTVRRWRVRFMTCGGRGAGGLASWPRVARCTIGCAANLCISAGRPSSGAFSS
jgi:hypothetical protein